MGFQHSSGCMLASVGLQRFPTVCPERRDGGGTVSNHFSHRDVYPLYTRAVLETYFGSSSGTVLALLTAVRLHLAQAAVCVAQRVMLWQRLTSTHDFLWPRLTLPVLSGFHPLVPPFSSSSLQSREYRGNFF